MSSKQPIGRDGRDRTLPAPERPEGSDPGTPDLSQSSKPTGWRVAPGEGWELLQHLPSGCVLIQRDGSILYSNQAFLDLVGRDQASACGARLQDFLTPGAVIFYETQYLPSLLIRGALQEISFDFRKPDGERVATLVNASLRAPEAGEQTSILLAVFGARQRRLYEAELLRSRREGEVISEVVRRSSDAILRISNEDLIENWNRGAEQIFGYAAQLAVGKSIYALIAEEHQGSFKATIEEMKLGQEVVAETIGRRDTGEPLNVSVNLSPNLEAPGILVGYSAIIRNITHHKLAEKALLQTEKLASVGRLASSIAHEINNPLEAVTNLLYILGLKATDSDTKALIRLAQEELARVSQITTHTLRFHKQSSNRTTVDLAALFASIIGLFRARFQNVSIQVLSDAQDQSKLVCFEGELRQILLNLVGNAFDAMKAGGKLVLRSRNITFGPNHRSYVRITVADTGTGMDAAIMDRLFEPFFSTKGIGGTGLGLWISKDLVEKNQGSIRVRSSTRGGRSGTVVSMRFPVQPA